MNTEKVIKNWKTIVALNLITGLLLLSAGIIFDIYNINIVQNNKALVGLSFIPLAVALCSFVNLLMLKRSPRSMRDIVISETDERLTAIRNEADAKAFRVLRWALLLAFFGYTLMVPSDVFEAIGWWILLVFFFISQFLPAVFYKIGFGKDSETKE